MLWVKCSGNLIVRDARCNPGQDNAAARQACFKEPEATVAKSLVSAAAWGGPLLETISRHFSVYRPQVKHRFTLP